MHIVPVDEIPEIVVDCPTDSLVDLYEICLQMQQVCRSNDGIGLSAVQVGIPWKLFVVRYTGRNPRPGNIDFFRYFVNCNYTPLTGDKEKSLEGCLSLRKPNGELRYFEVERFRRIKLVGQELKVTPKLGLVGLDVEYSDVYRIVYQHEIDHDGNGGGKPTLISDIGTEIDMWEN
jgi:peptide deformylase